MDEVHLRIEAREETVDLELPPARLDDLLEARLAAVLGGAGTVLASPLPVAMGAR